MSSSILGYGSTVYPLNTQMSPPHREAPGRRRHRTRKLLTDAFADVPDDEARKIVEPNARALYHFEG
jgi:hypothetical protein